MTPHLLRVKMRKNAFQKNCSHHIRDIFSRSDAVLGHPLVKYTDGTADSRSYHVRIPILILRSVIRDMRKAGYIAVKHGDCLLKKAVTAPAF